MTALYLVSTAGAAGKTALATVLGRRLQTDGLKVSYFQPVTADDPGADRDYSFVAEQLRISAQPPAVIRLGSQPSPGASAQLASRLKEAGAGADVVLVEGPADLTAGTEHGLAPADVAAAINARVLLVSRYRSSAVAGQIADAKQRFGIRLIGVLFNAVPAERLARAEATVRPLLEAAGVPLLAILPYEPALAGVTIRELAEQLGGRFLTAEDLADELVENLIVGSMSLEFAKVYFDRIPDKAVIVYTDKPEVQLAALESPTKCLISCGKGKPSPVVVARSEELGIPIVRVQEDALVVAERAEGIYSRARFHQSKKLAVFERLVAASFDIPALYRGLGTAAHSVRTSRGTGV